MKTYQQVLIFIFSSLLISACGGGVGDYDLVSPATPDTTPPQVISEDPPDSITVNYICAITAEFDEPIDDASIDDASFQIVHSAAGTLVDPTDGSWGLSASSTTIIEFVPAANLPSGTVSVTISTAVTDTAGNNLATAYLWTFPTNGDLCPTIPDTTAPQVTAVYPLDTTTVSSICAITATFDEPIAATSVDNTSLQIIHSAAGTLGPADGTWELSPIDSTKIMFTPSSDLPSGTVDVTATTAITDTSGNNLASNFAWTFDTDGVPCPP